jgi:hypothetical protein
LVDVTDRARRRVEVLAEQFDREAATRRRTANAETVVAYGVAAENILRVNE